MLHPGLPLRSAGHSTERKAAPYTGLIGGRAVGVLKHQLINPSTLCASSGFISRICSSL
jgi:hypothetical protein